MTALFPGLKGYKARPVSAKDRASVSPSPLMQGATTSPSMSKEIKRDLRITARNSMVLPSMARNMASLVRIWGGKPAKVPKGYTETQYISEVLTKIKRFAVINRIHIILIAHPRKIDKQETKSKTETDEQGNQKNVAKFRVPNLYDINGSANFYNKCDNGITVYRDLEDNSVSVYIQKVKYKFVGKIGKVDFKYELITNRYSDNGDGNFPLPVKLYCDRMNIDFTRFRKTIQIQQQTTNDNTNINEPPF